VRSNAKRETKYLFYITVYGRCGSTIRSQNIFLAVNWRKIMRKSSKKKKKKGKFSLHSEVKRTCNYNHNDDKNKLRNNTFETLRYR
jgi:hypothetical protein